MVREDSAVIRHIKNFIVLLFILCLLFFAVPIYKSANYHLDNKVLEMLLLNVVHEGEQDKLYGIDQIFAYLDKGLKLNNTNLNAREVVKALDMGEYVDLTIDYRRDVVIFSDFYLSTVFHKTYRAKLN